MTEADSNLSFHFHIDKIPWQVAMTKLVTWVRIGYWNCRGIGFFWPGMQMNVACYINSCPRCIRRKSQPDTAPLHNIEATQPLELIHLDYLQIEPSKGNIENVLIVTDHFTRYAQAYPSKHRLPWQLPSFCGIIL